MLQCLFCFADMVEFTDEEGYGKYLDLHECYEKYINLKGVEVSYLLNIEYSDFESCYICFKI